MCPSVRRAGFITGPSLRKPRSPTGAALSLSQRLSVHLALPLSLCYENVNLVFGHVPFAFLSLSPARSLFLSLYRSLSLSLSDSCVNLTVIYAGGLRTKLHYHTLDPQLHSHSFEQDFLANIQPYPCRSGSRIAVSAFTVGYWVFRAA